MGRVVDRNRLIEILATIRSGKALVFTNGCFDLIHPGHIDILRRAKNLGDILVVGVNDDKSVSEFKGPGRPIQVHEDRMAGVAALPAVDYVVGFSEDTPVKLIDLLRPDIHVKGGDYSPEDMPETPVVKAYGGRVVILPLLKGHSTTRLIEKTGKSGVKGRKSRKAGES